MRKRNSKIAANLTREKIVDLRVPGNAGRGASLGIEINRMPSTLPQELTIVDREMTQEITPLHAESLRY